MTQLLTIVLVVAISVTIGFGTGSYWQYRKTDARAVSMETWTDVPTGEYFVTPVGEGFDQKTGAPVYWLILEESRVEDAIPVHTGNYRFGTIPKNMFRREPTIPVRPLRDIPHYYMTADGVGPLVMVP